MLRLGEEEQFFRCLMEEQVCHYQVDLMAFRCQMQS